MNENPHGLPTIVNSDPVTGRQSPPQIAAGVYNLPSGTRTYVGMKLPDYLDPPSIIHLLDGSIVRPTLNRTITVDSENIPMLMAAGWRLL